MKRTIIISLFAFCLAFPTLHADVCRDWDTLDKKIRDSKIAKETAKKKIIALNRELKTAFSTKITHSVFSFPVKDYYSNSIGGSNGSGYVTGGYDYYDGNKHTGHPAHDIFVADKNRDSLCDRTGKPVEILSFTDGVVISVNRDWEPGSAIRGGKYTWIYNPVLDRYFYYAHLEKVLVNVGDIVKSGSRIAYLGRSGKNAFKKRSPTHLHFMSLSFHDGKMSPVDTYKELLESKTVRAGETNRFPWLRGNASPRERIKDIPPPANYSRVSVTKGSFAEWLRDLPLKPVETAVYLHNGKKKGRQDVHYRVLDIDTGTGDLQQCADAAMRLRAEYLFSRERFDKIRFNFVSGFNADYPTWRKGYRVIVNGNRCRWEKKAGANTGYKSFKKYMRVVFSYANTHSLSREMKPVRDVRDIRIGDLFIEGGFPGHAVIVVDMATDGSGNRVFLLAQSYMPAQDIHILKSPFPISPWYDIRFGDQLETPEWTFKKTDLKRF